MTDPHDIAEQRRIQSAAADQWKQQDEVRAQTRAVRRADAEAWQARATGNAPAEPAPYVVGRDLIQHLPEASAKRLQDVIRETAHVDFRPQPAAAHAPQAPNGPRPAMSPALRDSPNTFF